MSMSNPSNLNAAASDQAVRERYAAAARVREAALCCPVDYDARYLESIPAEVIERDYGCGDPSRHVREGDTVLDLGSGGGKVAFIASQVVGPGGRVIGVDVNVEMLELARRSRSGVAERVGFSNVEFRRGRIEDLALDLDTLDAWLAANPVNDCHALDALEAERARLRRDQPLVESDSIDIVVSNCVLNLVREDAKKQLIREIFRVLKRGGRIAISDIVADEAVPSTLTEDPELWSGCISGAFQELDLLHQLEAAGFYGMRWDKWEEEPFAVVDGIEFRSVTVTAHKGKEGPCEEANQAVVYAGPWKRVEDDDGHVFERGVRNAVCDKTFEIMTKAPYGAETIGIEPRCALPREERVAFDCARHEPRHPRETKGQDYRVTRSNRDSGCC
jgi:ubiquinone/menaquinone biosynthesis C-methylase UbiE